MRSRFVYYLCASVMLHLFAFLCLPLATIGGHGSKGMLPVRVHLLSGDDTAPGNLPSESDTPVEARARPIPHERSDTPRAEDAMAGAAASSASERTPPPVRGAAEDQPIPAEPHAANPSSAAPRRTDWADVKTEPAQPPETASSATGARKTSKPAVLRTTAVYRGTRTAASSPGAATHSTGTQGAAARTAGGQENDAAAQQASGELSSRVRYARVVKPDYPEEARSRGWEGTTLLRVLVNRSGTSDEVQVHRSSGFDLLDHAAVDALRRWEFHPARHGAHAVQSWVQVPIVFKLEEEN